jgi:PKD repeat protein
MKGTWSSLSGGTFEDGAIPPNITNNYYHSSDPNYSTRAVNYNLSTQDIQNGSVILKLTSEDPTQAPFNSVCPAKSLDVAIAINQVATVSPGPNQVFCVGNNTKPRVYTYPLNGSIGGAASSLTWSSLGRIVDNPTNNTASYTLSPNEIGSLVPFQVTFTISSDDPNGPCPLVQQTKTYTFNPPAIANAGGDNSICSANGAVPISGTVSSGVTTTWSGGGGFINDDTSLSTTYTPSTTESLNGAIVILTLTTSDPDGTGPGGPCVAESDQMQLTIKQTPSAPVAIQPKSYCVNDVINNLSAQGSLGSTLKWYSNPGLTTQIGVGASFATGVFADGVKSVDFYVTQTPSSGCESLASSATIVVNPLPTPNFTATNFCLGQAMTFTDASTISAGTITEWEWSFDGDVLLSGAGGIPAGTHGGRTTGTFSNPSHSFVALGNYTVSLNVKSAAGCFQATDINSSQYKFKVGPVPVANFNNRNICNGDNTQLSFTAGPAQNETLTVNWDFGDAASPVNTSNQDSPTHKFSAVGNYNVRLSLTTALGCSDDTTKTVFILPYIQSFPYIESFEQAGHGWVTEGLNNNGLTSWQLKTPNGQLINSAYEGSKAWITRVDALGTYNNNERSVLNGPCVNIAALDRPVVSFKYWESTDAGNDGAYMEVSPDGGQTWFKLGGLNTGLGWYDKSSVLGLLTQNGVGQLIGQEGWSGSTPGWADGKYSLDAYKNLTKLRFRFVFGSNPDNPNKTLDGFAMDKFSIEKRNRTVLTENFINTSKPGFAAENTIYNGFMGNLTTSELVKLQYHTSIGGDDAIYNVNSADPSARAAFYGITNSFQGFVDGSSKGTLGLPWATTSYDYRSLVASPIHIDIATLPTTDDQLNIKATIFAVAPVPASQYAIQIAVVQKTLGSEQYVLRKLVPDAAGTPLTAFAANSSQTVTVAWPVKKDVDLTKVAIIVFVQNLNAVNGVKEVIQATVLTDPTNLPSVITGIETAFDANFNVYPSPADREMTVELPETAKELMSLKIYDQVGKAVHQSSFEKGDKQKVITTENLSAGMYLIQIQSQKGVLRRKVMVLHHN